MKSDKSRRHDGQRAGRIGDKESEHEDLRGEVYDSVDTACAARRETYTVFRSMRVLPTESLPRPIDANYGP